MNITMYVKNARLLSILIVAALVPGCGNKVPSDNAASSSGVSSAAPSATTASADAGAEATPPPMELFKPAAGKGNVQGKVLFDDKPAANIEVTLCEKFSTFLGPSGKSYTARTDKNGDYAIKDVPPKEYEGLTARVFDTNSVVFVKSGFVKSKTYNVEAGKTLFVDATNLFKSDLKILAPKASSTVPAAQAIFKWQAYPGAAYYKISINADDFKINSGVFGERVEGTSYQASKPLPAGSYRLEVEAYNDKDHKLAESPDQYKFRIAK